MGKEDILYWMWIVATGALIGFTVVFAVVHHGKIRKQIGEYLKADRPACEMEIGQ